MKIHSNLKNILSFNFFLVAVLPLLAVGLLTLKFLTVSLTTEIRGQNFSITKSLAGEVQRSLAEPLSIMHQVDRVVESKSLIGIGAILTAILAIASIAKALSLPSRLSSSGRNVAGGNHHFYGKRKTNGKLTN